MTEDTCKHCGLTVWSEYPNAGGSAWRDASDDWCCPKNPGRMPNSFSQHEVWAKPSEIEAAIASIRSVAQ